MQNLDSLRCARIVRHGMVFAQRRHVARPDAVLGDDDSVIVLSAKNGPVRSCGKGGAADARLVLEDVRDLSAGAGRNLRATDAGLSAEGGSWHSL